MPIKHYFGKSEWLKINEQRPRTASATCVPGSLDIGHVETQTMQTADRADSVLFFLLVP